MQDIQQFSSYLVRQDAITFVGETGSIEKYVDSYYTSLEMLMKIALPFSREGFIHYVNSLFYYRVSQVNGVSLPYYQLKEVYMPSFVESCLVYIHAGYDKHSGFSYTWENFKVEPMSIQELVQFSLNLSMLSKSINDLVKGYPTSKAPNSDCLYINVNDEVCAFSSTSPQEVGISAMLHQHLSSDTAHYNLCFRKKLASTEYAISEVMNGTAL